MKKICIILFFCLVTLKVFAGAGTEIAIPVDAKSEYIINIPPNDGTILSNGGIMKVMRYVELPPEAKERPENMKFAAFDILIDNSKGDSDITDNDVTSSFIIRDSNGFEYKLSFMTYDIIKPSFPSTTIEQGDILRGWITFTAPLSLKLNDFRIRFSAGNRYLEKTMITSGWTTFSGF